MRCSSSWRTTMAASAQLVLSGTLALGAGRPRRCSSCCGGHCGTAMPTQAVAAAAARPVMTEAHSRDPVRCRRRRSGTRASRVLVQHCLRSPLPVRFVLMMARLILEGCATCGSGSGSGSRGPDRWVFCQPHLFMEVLR